MKIMGMGLDFNGKPLFQAKDEKEVINVLINALESNATNLKNLSQGTSEAVFFRGEVEHTIPNPGDPVSAGWTFIINSKDPNFDKIKKILKPLAKHRTMENPNKPLLFNISVKFHGIKINYHIR